MIREPGCINSTFSERYKYRMFEDNSMHKESIKRSILKYKILQMKKVLHKRKNETRRIRQALKSKVSFMRNELWLGF